MSVPEKQSMTNVKFNPATMTIDLVQVARDMGISAHVYGTLGMGKSPMLIGLKDFYYLCPERSNVAPQFIPEGKKSYFPTNACEAFGFLVWWLSDSAEVKNYAGLAMDSLTELCNFSVLRHRSNKSNLLQVYGEMTDEVMRYLNLLKFQKGKHFFCSGQLTFQDMEFIEGPNIIKKQVATPLYAGKELRRRIAHTFDLVLYAHKCDANLGFWDNRALMCRDVYNIAEARDRYGKLSSLEPTDLNHIINKILN